MKYFWNFQLNPLTSSSFIELSCWLCCYLSHVSKLLEMIASSAIKLLLLYSLWSLDSLALFKLRTNMTKKNKNLMDFGNWLLLQKKIRGRSRQIFKSHTRRELQQKKITRELNERWEMMMTSVVDENIKKWKKRMKIVYEQ